MKATTKLASVIGLVAATAPLVATAQSPLDNKCIIEIALGSGKDNYVFNTSASAREIGYWDVDPGGAKADGLDLGSSYINLSTLSGPMASQECIEDIRLVAGDWDQERNPPPGYRTVGYWDIDSGGSGDSNGNSSEHRMTLFAKKMAKTSDESASVQVIYELYLNVYDTKPSAVAFGARQENGYRRVGWWDVDDGGACGGTKGVPECGAYGAVLGVAKKPFVSGEQVKTLVLTGRWEPVNTCRGTQCGETSFQLTVGAEQGKEISKTSTVGKSLTAMVGLETSVSGGASVPLVADGEVSVTARVEVSGEISEEYQDAIVNSFTSKRESTNAVTCAGAGVMWQWKSNLRIERLSRVEDVAADSLLTVCAPVGVKPPHGNDIAWDPTLAGKFPLAAGAQFDRGGDKVPSPSGNH